MESWPSYTTAPGQLLLKVFIYFDSVNSGNCVFDVFEKFEETYESGLEKLLCVRLVGVGGIRSYRFTILVTV